MSARRMSFPLRLGHSPADDLSSSLAHFFNRLCAVVWVDVHGAHRVAEGFHFKAFAQSVQHGVLYTIVGGQSADQNFLDSLITQDLSQVRTIEPRITIAAS